MKVALKAITPEIEQTIVEIARVSSSRKDKKESPEGLINYLIKNWHWSPFEHGYATMEIETSKAIGIQLLRHRSFTFQEFSQRYQDVSKVINDEDDDDIFEHVEIRKQAVNNRQSSEEVFDPILYTRPSTEDPYLDSEGDLTYSDVGLDSPFDDEEVTASEAIGDFFMISYALYDDLLKAGVAREQARMVLPMATKTKIYMTGSIRSWIHFIKLRDDGHAQKEAQEIARAIKDILVKELPIISKALGWKQ
jgi:thymidylate synthase (FAD)